MSYSYLKSHNLKVVGSNPTPATNETKVHPRVGLLFYMVGGAGECTYRFGRKHVAKQHVGDNTRAQLEVVNPTPATNETKVHPRVGLLFYMVGEAGE